MVVTLTDLPLMQGKNALNQLSRLKGIAFDQPKSLMHFLLRIDRALVGLTQGINSSHDVAEVVRKSHREDTKSFLPNSGSQPLLSNGLARNIDPGPIIAQNQAVAAQHRFAPLEDVRNFARLAVADAKCGCNRFASLALRKLSLKLARIRFMNDIPEFLGPPTPVLDRDPGPILDLLGNKTESEIRPLTEQDAWPLAAEQFYLGFRPESASVKLAARFLLSEILVPGSFSEFVNRWEAARNP